MNFSDLENEDFNQKTLDNLANTDIGREDDPADILMHEEELPHEDDNPKAVLDNYTRAIAKDPTCLSLLEEGLQMTVDSAKKAKQGNPRAGFEALRPLTFTKGHQTILAILARALTVDGLEGSDRVLWESQVALEDILKNASRAVFKEWWLRSKRRLRLMKSNEVTPDTIFSNTVNQWLAETHTNAIRPGEGLLHYLANQAPTTHRFNGDTLIKPEFLVDEYISEFAEGWRAEATDLELEIALEQIRAPIFAAWRMIAELRDPGWMSRTDPDALPGYGSKPVPGAGAKPRWINIQNVQDAYHEYVSSMEAWIEAQEEATRAKAAQTRNFFQNFLADLARETA